MPEKAKDLSMFNKVEEHDKTLSDHEALLLLHAEEIKELKISDEKMFLEIEKLNAGFTKVENVIWSSAKETRDAFAAQNKMQWDLINALSEGKREERKDWHDLKKTRVEKFWEFMGKLTVGGGVLIVALELVFGR